MTAGRLGIGTLRSVLQNLIIEGREQQRRCLATDPAAASRAPVIMPTSDAHNHECARDPDRDRFFRLSASGALIGTSAERLNKGDEDKFAQKISRKLTPGKAVVVAEIAEDDLSALELLMKQIGGTVVRK